MYPWGDFHSLNLGWFLVQFKEWTEKIQEYLDNGGGTSENLANVIAPVFNAENSYLTGDYVLYNDELYKANQAVNPGTWNPDAWTRCLVTEEMGSGSGGVDNVARLMIAGQYSNTYNYQKYAICRYNDKLWMCNTNLPAGGEEWEPSHWDEITVGAGLTGLRRSLETLSNAITDLQNIVGDGTLSGFTATDLTGAANELKGSLNNVQEQITAYIQTTLTATRTYNKNDFFVYNEVLYKVKQTINSGSQITIGTNATASNIGAELSNIKLDNWAIFNEFISSTETTINSTSNRSLDDFAFILFQVVRAGAVRATMLITRSLFAINNDSELIITEAGDSTKTYTFRRISATQISIVSSASASGARVQIQALGRPDSY